MNAIKPSCKVPLKHHCSSGVYDAWQIASVLLHGTPVLQYCNAALLGSPDTVQTMAKVRGTFCYPGVTIYVEAAHTHSRFLLAEICHVIICSPLIGQFGVECRRQAVWHFQDIPPVRMRAVYQLFDSSVPSFSVLFVATWHFGTFWPRFGVI